ncbi:aconitate hydratase [Aminiphilus circumscriptus]|uniref:aconitate hydratase n=1 Tax=Aminiphilus circumscriptus TaxID=290732 RepID=UPI0004785A5B|nr:aconitate hydratase [Aminiphilus circumscriptus]
MGYSIVEKLVRSHFVEGSLAPGEELSLKVDQTLNPDSAGTMAFIQFEAIGIPRVQVGLAVSYADHQTLQVGFENADDHLYLQDVAARFGVHFSRAGNGICHQVHLERFAAPGKFLLGTDSHTPTAGGMGMLAIAVGGVDLALAMAGRPFTFSMPRVTRVELKGSLPPWVAAKDVILEVLRRLTCSGGVGKIIEYGGPGVACLSVPERGTITNMGAELGATSSVFPSDGRTREFLEAQGRGDAFVPLQADDDAMYDEVLEIDLSTLEPLVALPHFPDNVVPVREAAGLSLNQVFIGSCTNSSYVDLSRAAAILKGKLVAENTSLVVAPGSRQVLHMIAQSGALADLIAAGARILESACGPCIGIGQSPCSGGTSLRTSNRNFEGRSGTKDAKVFLASVETAAASALTGRLTDPRTLGNPISVPVPSRFHIDDRMILVPPVDGSGIEIRRGPNIRSLPPFPPLAETVRGEVLLKVGDNITTDHIMPAGAKVMPYRSNVPAISRFCFATVDETFYDRAVAAGGGLIVGGCNYGQGSSREHAALAPRHLGVKAVLAKSYARIHRKNLINMGIAPLVFDEEGDYDRIKQGDFLSAEGLYAAVEAGVLLVRNETRNEMYRIRLPLLPLEKELLQAGGALNHARICLRERERFK